MYEPFMKFAIPASFADLAGNIIARKYKTSAGDGLHIFITLIAQTTIGKTQAIKSAASLSNNLITDKHHTKRIIEMAVSSKQGFHETLERGCFTWTKDECAPQLQQILSPGANDQAAQNMQAFVNELFYLGCIGDEPYLPAASLRSKHDGDKAIPNLCISTFWATTDTKIDEFLSKEAVSSGAISRMLLISHRTDGGKYKGSRTIKSVATG